MPEAALISSLPSLIPMAKENMKEQRKVMIAGIITLVVIAVIILVVVLIIKRKKAVKSVPLPSETNWGQSLTINEQADIIRISDGLYQEMKGVAIFGHDMDIYKEYLNTSDRVFVGVANYFYEKYGGGKNLANWIKEEVFIVNSIPNAILARLLKFNITSE